MGAWRGKAGGRATRARRDSQVMGNRSWVIGDASRAIGNR